MSAQSRHTRRSASLLVSALLVSLLSLGACTKSYTSPEDPTDYDYARQDMKAALVLRPSAAKKEARMNPKGDRAVASVSMSEIVVSRMSDKASTK
jgi:hypothetical protein